MPRNKVFHSGREPLQKYNNPELRHSTVHGPFSFLNPTRVQFRHNDLSSQSNDDQNGSPMLFASDEEKAVPGKDEQLADDVEFHWRARDNRKGRHALLVVPPTKPGSAKYIVPKRISTLRETWKGIVRMCTQFPYWDVSWLVATSYTLGSVVWVINSFFVWLPLVAPGTEFNDEILTGGGVTAFIGATIFEFGSALLMFEAVNANLSGCFGWALEKVLEGEKGGMIRMKATQHECEHHHANKKNFVGNGHGQALINRSSEESPEDPSSSQFSNGKTWRWFPSWTELRTHYFHELGFLASLAQFCGASIFWISGFTALPGINNKMSQGLLDGIYWTPQIVGGSGFIISGVLFLLETQPNWYTPAPHLLGWHIALWNLIGGFGFTLCGALGPAYLNSGAEYEASLATFWGSWSFLIGSIIQWYESLDKHPVEVKCKEPS